jgi:hypothetical protein
VSPENSLRVLQGNVLADLTGRGGEGPGQTCGWFRTPPRGTREARWAVYTHGYLARLIDALEGDYPALHRILGPEPFAALAERYLSQHPPRSFDLGHVGGSLSRFLRFDRLTVELPFLSDLAALERAIVEAFVAEDSDPVTWSDLQKLSGDRIADLRFRPCDGTRVIRSPWPLLDLLACRDLADDEVSVDTVDRPCVALVVRRGFSIVTESIGDHEASLIEAAAWGGVSLSDLESGTEREDTGHGERIAQLVATFRQVIDRGVFVTNRPAGDTGEAEI